MAAWFRGLFLLLLLPLSLADSECGGFELMPGFGLEDLENPGPRGVRVLESPSVDLDEECWEKCCANPKCDLAMLRGPDSECRLISCVYLGYNMCELREVEGTRSYRKANVGPRPTQENFCLPQSETGRCRAYFVRWWYDAESQMCKNFTYGGCLGNLNNHMDEQQCMSKCSGVTVSAVQQPEKVKAPKSPHFEEYCTEPKYTGQCRAAFQRWYYDNVTGTCSTFTYGGCNANKNNYPSQDECIRSCIDDQDVLHHRSVTALILPVLLAVMAGFLLCVMVLFFVKMARNSQRASDFRAMWNPIDDKECLMNNAYTL